MLKDQFPQMKGLQDPVLGTKLHFEIAHGSFVQVLHDGSLHWVTVRNLFSRDNTVELYDSLYSSVPMSIKMQIASIIMTNERSMHVKIQKFQRQQGGVDCGLFAIAAATDLCNGRDPSTSNYKQTEMRSHLLQALKDAVLLPFPSESVTVKSKTVKAIQVPLWCSCRLPDNGEEKMAECGGCDDYYHKTCASIPREVFQNNQKAKEWRCRDCVDTSQ
ncbi:hypothetical protein KUCAC02_010414 [Chaenocephalus aceratus]|uniref:Uncharacterized protein n=1 Tax=Chaenocephalus aceratus TaxID=36190 RepID=A0ACB9W0A1_CHAAC|nr:hypothetical protein KUCAC02_010414 [Chaenocephalus aceratus]